MTNKNSFSEYLEINGKKQFLSVRTKKDRLPILLYLHGGPGDAAYPLVRKYNSNLENYFTVAVWEQRGTGKSYYPFHTQEKISISTFLKDIYSIAEFLLMKFNQSKLYVVGHSWGSVLGLQFCKQYPHLIHQYIGCGQVVNMKKSSRAAYEFAIENCNKNGNKRAYNRLKQIDCTYSSKSWLNDLLFVTQLVVKYGGSLYGHKSYSPFIKDFIFSPDYSIIDLINRQKGSLQSIQYLWQELMTIDFEKSTNLPVPIVFVEGKYDFHVSSILAKEYFNTLVSPKLFFWFEKSCHFPQWSEAERFLEVMCSLQM